MSRHLVSRIPPFLLALWDLRTQINGVPFLFPHLQLHFLLALMERKALNTLLYQQPQSPATCHSEEALRTRGVLAEQQGKLQREQ